MNNGSIDALFGAVILKVVVTIGLLIGAQIVGHLASRRLAIDRSARQALGQIIAIVLSVALVYLLLVSRFAIA
jgi:hypothetical protein